MLVALHRERLERSLVEVSFTFTVMSLLRATHMRRRHLVHEGRDLVVQFRPQNEMPVIGHQAVSQDSQRDDQQRLLHDAHEGLVICRARKECSPPIPAIEHVKDGSARAAAFGTRHVMFFRMGAHAPRKFPSTSPLHHGKSTIRRITNGAHQPSSPCEKKQKK
jgi:hypothetical protein